MRDYVPMKGPRNDNNDEAADLIATLQRELAEANRQLERQRVEVRDTYRSISDNKNFDGHFWDAVTLIDAVNWKHKHDAIQSWKESVLAEVGPPPCSMPKEPADIYQQYQCAFRLMGYFSTRAEHLAARLVQTQNAPRIELICAARLLDCLHEIVELGYPPDDDHRKVMQETDSAIGRLIGDIDDQYRDYRNPLPVESTGGHDGAALD